MFDFSAFRNCFGGEKNRSWDGRLADRKISPWGERVQIIFDFQGSSSKCTSSHSNQPQGLNLSVLIPANFQILICQPEKYELYVLVSHTFPDTLLSYFLAEELVDLCTKVVKTEKRLYSTHQLHSTRDSCNQSKSEWYYESGSSLESSLLPLWYIGLISNVGTIALPS